MRFSNAYFSLEVIIEGPYPLERTRGSRPGASRQIDQPLPASAAG